MPFIEYYGLKSAIPSSWKQILQDTDRDDIEDYKLIDMIDDTINPSKILYRLMLKEKIEVPHEKTQKWSDHLERAISIEDFIGGLEQGRKVP